MNKKVKLVKLGSNRTFIGKLQLEIIKGGSVKISLDPQHEYVTSRVERVFKVAGKNTIYFNTQNKGTYKLIVLDEAA